MAATSIRLVVFDLGRVLVRICDSWSQACAAAGVEITGPAADPTSLARLNDLLHQAEVGRIGTGELFDRAAEAMRLEPSQIRSMSEAFIFGPYPGATQLLDDLNAARVPTACLSNTNAHHWELLSRPGHRAWFPLDRLTHRFASHLVRARKPDAEIYGRVEREVGLPGEALLFFDDVAENVAAARSRGWTAVRIDPALNDPIGQIRSTLRQLCVWP